MNRGPTRTIRFRGRREDVLEVFRVRGRTYFGLEKLSARGAYRVFDPHAGPSGDYRALYRIPLRRVTLQRIEVLRRMTGPTANRSFSHITDCTRVGDDLFVIVSWVWGTNLREYLRAVRKSEVPRPVLPEVIRLIRGLAHGISHYHRRANLVHGDISPANIVLTSGTKQLVLIDFGSAWPVEQTAEKDHGDGITNPYAAPERIVGRAAEDFRSDIFSLSVIAYELLTLEIPYDGLGGHAGLPEFATCQELCLRPTGTIWRMRWLPRNARAALDEYFHIGLALHADDRFPTRERWLSVLDSVFEYSKSSDRLSRIESFAVSAIESLIGFAHRRIR